jgi:hypothetical protein
MSRPWPSHPRDVPLWAWAALAVLLFFVLLPIALRVYGAYWGLVMGIPGAFLELFPRV